MKHCWVENVLATQIVEGKNGLMQQVPVCWFPRCSECGCLVTEVGKKLMYRALSNSEWQYEEPECSAK